MANHNVQRLAEDIKREISVAMQGLKDKAVAEGLVTVTQVDLTNDLSYCKVYVSALGGGEKTEEAVKALQKAEGYFKRIINGRIKMHKLPQLIFTADNSLDYYEKISKIISNLPPAAQEEAEEVTDKSGNGNEE